MSRHLAEVATSTLNQKLLRHQHAKKLRSRHHSMVVTSVAKKEGREIIQQSRYQMQEIKVATSAAKKRGRDIIQWSRHQFQRKKVAMSLSGRDINCEDLRSRHHLAVATSSAKERRSRRHSVVATSVARKGGHDII